MGVLLVRDTTLYFQDAGKGDSLLFIHGICGDANAWDRQVSDLAPSFRCVTYDCRGHTRSPLGQMRFPSVSVHVDDAADLIAALGLAPVIVVSSDYGAETSLELIRRYPEMVRGAVLSEPIARSLDLPVANEVWSELVKVVQGSRPARIAVDEFFTALGDGAWERLPDARREAARANHAALLGALMARPDILTPADLAEISVPVLVISGTRSGVCLRQAATAIAARIPKADRMCLADAGCFPYLDRPKHFSDAVRSFARRLTGSAAPALGSEG